MRHPESVLIQDESVPPRWICQHPFYFLFFIFIFFQPQVTLACLAQCPGESTVHTRLGCVVRTANESITGASECALSVVYESIHLACKLQLFSIPGERVGILANNCGQIYPYFTQKIPKLVNRSGCCDLQKILLPAFARGQLL